MMLLSKFKLRWVIKLLRGFFFQKLSNALSSAAAEPKGTPLLPVCTRALGLIQHLSLSSPDYLRFTYDPQSPAP